jgi:S-adenosylmethionine hydrolase
MTRPIITLTTDFGTGSPYVAQMKGVILTINPEVALVDVTHAIGPQNIRQGALVLADTALEFPAGTIHVAVVDPGVGTERTLIYAAIGGHHFVAPDNGLLSGLAARHSPTTMIELARSEYWRPEPSSTFHGRDILAPVAARLSLGLAPSTLGPPRTELVQLDWPEARILSHKIEGEVISVDSFGNLVTNITTEMLTGAPTDETLIVRCDEHETHGLFRAYADQPPMTLIALIGSSGRLELAIVDDSAKIMLGVGEGERVTVTW